VSLVTAAASRAPSASHAIGSADLTRQPLPGIGAYKENGGDQDAPRSRLRCHSGDVDDWLEVAWLEPDASTDPKAGLDLALDSFLSQRGLSRKNLADRDVRLDLVYLGPAWGGCAKRLMIRSTALPK